MSDPPAGVLSLRFVGDIVLGNSHVVKSIPASWEREYFESVAPILRAADASVGNLEGALTEYAVTTKNTATGRSFAFRFPPHYAEVMRAAGFKAMHLANNHSNDFGAVGFADTLKALAAASLVPVGVKGQIGFLEIKGLRIALLGFGFYARQDMIQDLDAVRGLVQRARSQAQIVIVTFHAGAEGASAVLHPDADELFLGENRGNAVAFSRAAIDAGADAVVGHGPHVLRALECYKGRPVFHSLANFVGVGGLSIRGLAALSAIGGLQFDAAGKLLAIEFQSVVFDDRKLPRPDPRDFAAHLVNWAGSAALYPGSFLQVPVDPQTRSAFEAWFAPLRSQITGRSTP